MEFTKQEIDNLVKKNEQEILEVIREGERDYARSSWQQTEVLFFDLTNEESFFITSGQGYTQDIYNKVNDGKIVKLYEFTTGCFEECAIESFHFDGAEGQEIIQRYENEEIDEEEYEKLLEPLIDEYIEDYISNAIDESCIDIDYLNALKDEY